MTIAESIGGLVEKPKVATIGVLLSTILLIILACGCSSVIRNSEGFYEKIPRRPINWREYMTD